MSIALPDEVSISRIFADIAERPPALWPAGPDARTRFRNLKDAGLLVRAPDLQGWVCASCQTLHRVTVRDGRVFAACANGNVPLASEDLWTWQVSPAGVGAWLRAALGLGGDAEWKLAGHLLYLGDFPAVGGAFPVWMLCNVRSRDVVDRANAELGVRSPAEAGVVIAQSPDLSGVEWKRGTRLALLSDVMKWDGDVLAVDRRAILAVAPRAAQGEHRAGRPLKAGLSPVEVFQSRIANGQALKTGLSHEARAIRKQMVDQAGEARALAEKSIGNAIAGAYRAWKERGFPTDGGTP